MAVLLQADKPVEKLGDTLTRTILQAAHELCLGERDGDLLIRDGVAEREVQRRDRERVRIWLPGEEGDEPRAGVFEREQCANLVGIGTIRDGKVRKRMGR